MLSPDPAAPTLKVALFGAGARGVQCLMALGGDRRFEITCFFDNDPKKWNTTLRGIPICEPTADACGRVDAIILASIYAKEILAQLARLGCAGKVALSPPHLSRRFGAADDATSGEVMPAEQQRERLLDEAPAAIRGLASRFDADPRPPRPAGVAARQEVACTICCNNYLAYAIVLARSFLRHHPGGRFFICLVDSRRDDVAYPADSRIAIIEAASLGIEGFDSFAFKYDVLELNTAVKPFLLQRLIENEGAERLLYLDPDILVLAPLDELFEQLTRTPLLLTPHLTQPYRDDHHPREIDILRAGTYNLGFVGVVSHSQTTDLLSWWQQRLYDGCTREVDKGYFVDQKWMDLVPSFFPGHTVVRDPGYNAAYWNLHERTVTFERGRFEVNGHQLRFFHFSGVDVHDIESVSRHQNRVTLPSEGALRDLFELYRVLLVTHGHLELRSEPYAYGCFDNGVRIPDVVRSIYRETRLAGAYPDPFDADGESSFYAWLRAPWRPGSLISNLFASMHARALELRIAYPTLDVAGELALLLHMKTAAELYGLPSELVDNDPRPFAAPIEMGPAKPMGSEATATPSQAVRLPRRVARSTSSPPHTEGHRPEGSLRVTVTPSKSGAAASFTAALDAAIRLAVGSEGPSAIVAGTGSMPSQDVAGAIVMGPVELSPRKHHGARLPDVAYWMWDESWTNDLPSAQPREIWVPSSYSLEGLSHSTSVPIVEMPLPVGLIAPSRTTREGLGVAADKRVLFVSVVDPVTRRGHDPVDTVRAFQEAFASHADSARPVLTIVATDTDIARHVRQRLAPLGPDSASVQVRHLPAGPDLVRLLCAADCYVSLHGSVAFDRWLAYALWHGRPAVTTQTAGVTDVATVNNSFLVSVARDGCAGDTCPQPDIAHAASLLRMAVECREERRNRGARARRDVRSAYSVEAVARRMARRLALVAGSQPASVSTPIVGAA
jgi:glycosyltransferase involved in cell wall biosynthesis